MNNFCEKEVQTLIGMMELVAPITTPNNNGYSFFPKTIHEAKKYFRKFALAWEDAYLLLSAKGYINKKGSTYILTKQGKSIASKLRLERPPIWYWYKEYYQAVRTSKAHSIYCEQLFGRDLSQDGFSDIKQIDRMLEIGVIARGNLLLDLGCGNGRISEYISDKIGCTVYGMDYIPEAIIQAEEKTTVKRHRLKFFSDNLDNLPFENNSFDTVISIDSFYMPNNIDLTLSKVMNILKDNGKLLVFFTQIAFKEDEKKSLCPDETRIGKVLKKNRITFEYHDFSKENYEHLQIKYKIVKSLKNLYETEGNRFLYDSILEQSIDNDLPYDEKTCNIRRYLYMVRKRRNIFFG